MNALHLAIHRLHAVLVLALEVARVIALFSVPMVVQVVITDVETDVNGHVPENVQVIQRAKDVLDAVDLAQEVQIIQP